MRAKRVQRSVTGGVARSATQPERRRVAAHVRNRTRAHCQGNLYRKKLIMSTGMEMISYMI